MNLNADMLTATPPVGALVALVLALAGAIAVGVLFLNPRKRARYKGWLKKLSAHANFDHFAITTILKLLYAFCALFCVAYGLIELFSGAAVSGLLWLILAPIGLRVGFELMLMVMSIREEISDTNELLRRMQGLPPRNPPKPVEPAPARPAQARPPQADARYAAQPMGYPAQPTPYNAQRAGYTAQPSPYPPQPTGYGTPPRQQAPRQSDFGMTQRYTPVRRDEPAAASREAGAYTTGFPPVRPTPADGTGRFSAVPRRTDADPNP